MKPFIVCGVDVELCGNNNVLSVGIATYNLSTRQHSTELFTMPDTILPTDERGRTVLKRDGSLCTNTIEDYGSFSRQKWEGFWREHPKHLAAQIQWQPTLHTNKDVWQQIRMYIDTLTLEAARRGYRVRLTSDNLGVDVGIINEHFKRYITKRFDGDEVTLDHQLLIEGEERRHVVVVCAAFPQWQVRKHIIPPFDIPFVSVYLHKHRADHDALQSALMYSGYIKAYPQTESLKHHFKDPKRRVPPETFV